MKNNEQIELLAPAGSIEKLKWAIMYGANAVYIGGQDYSLRANAKNFSLADITEGVKYAHEHNAKVYVAVNILFHNNDINGLDNYLKELESIGVDAIIFSDPSVIDVVNKNNINLEMHLSTQHSTLNYETAKYFESKGVKRIVLGRECSKKDIELIRKNTNIDLEVFIHGAMCTGYSGRCTLSNYLTNRDSNRGGCSQICRWIFDLYDKDKNLIESETNFSIATKDLSMLKHIPELIDLGVKSFKIEGRMRSIYYIATILDVYRKVIDNYLKAKENYIYDESLEKVLRRCANRDSVPQFFYKKAGVNEQYYAGREEVSNQDFLGIVMEYDKENKELVVEQRNFFKVGDEIVIFAPQKEKLLLKVTYIKDIDGNNIDAARHPRQIVRIPCDVNIEVNSILRVDFS